MGGMKRKAQDSGNAWSGKIVPMGRPSAPKKKAVPAKSGIKAVIKPGLYSKRIKVAEVEEEPEDEEVEEDEDGDPTRYTGQITSSKGMGKFVITCEEVSAMHGADPKVTIKSNGPNNLSVGDWISFRIAEDIGAPLAIEIEFAEEPGDEEEMEDAEEVVEEEEEIAEEEEALEEEAEEAVEEEPEEDVEAEDEEVPEEDEEAEAEEEAEEDEEAQELVIAKSSAVARFRKAQATETAFTAGWKMKNGANGKIGAAAKIGIGSKKAPFKRAFIEPPGKLSKADMKALADMRGEMQITVEGQGSAFPPIMSFQELDGIIPDWCMEALNAQGFEAPMPVQAQALPLALSGHDLVGIAKTGSGKTLAYLLPAMVHIEDQKPVAKGSSTPICLILAPVRELAVQIAEEAQKLLGGSKAGSHPKGLSSVAIYGGGSSNKGWQIEALRKGCEIVAATPGRLVDLIEGRQISLSRVTYFVLDEADRMLDEGFGAQVNEINKQIRPDRQCMFFSATWPASVERLAGKICQNGSEPIQLTVGQNEEGGPTTREDIVQEVVVFDEPSWDERDAAKQELLYAHLREVLSHKQHKMLVFLSRKVLCDSMVNRLWAEGFKCQAMHGGKSQDSRLDILDQFKTNKLKLLVTTDVMGRGLDIPDISHVVVYDMGDIEDYVHRIGRTARGPYGKGHALTFFEYDRKWPNLASDLLGCLEQSEQEVPEDLARIAEEAANGQRGGGGW